MENSTENENNQRGLENVLEFLEGVSAFIESALEFLEDLVKEIVSVAIKFAIKAVMPGFTGFPDGVRLRDKFLALVGIYLVAFADHWVRPREVTSFSEAIKKIDQAVFNFRYAIQHYKNLAQNILRHVGQYFSRRGTALTRFAGERVAQIRGIWESIRAGIGNLPQSLKKLWVEIKKAFVALALTGIIWWNVFKMTLHLWWQKFLSSAFVNGVKAVFSAIMTLFTKKTLKLLLIAFAKKVTAVAITLAATIVGAGPALLKLAAAAALVSAATQMTVPSFAQGGFPTQNEPFIAREAGPELVGTLKDRTAVVNNDQIVEAVSKGVYEAFLSAITNDGFCAPAKASVYLDGELIATANAT